MLSGAKPTTSKGFVEFRDRLGATMAGGLDLAYGRVGGAMILSVNQAFDYRFLALA